MATRYRRRRIRSYSNPSHQGLIEEVIKYGAIGLGIYFLYEWWAGGGLNSLFGTAATAVAPSSTTTTTTTTQTPVTTTSTSQSSAPLSATISFTPNPLVPDSNGNATALVTVTTNSPLVDVFVQSGTGDKTAFCDGSGPQFTCQTGNWVSHGLNFIVQDQTTGVVIGQATPTFSNSGVAGLGYNALARQLNQNRWKM